jgi:hypothetical protein
MLSSKDTLSVHDLLGNDVARAADPARVTWYRSFSNRNALACVFRRVTLACSARSLG